MYFKLIATENAKNEQFARMDNNKLKIEQNIKSIKQITIDSECIVTYN